MNRTLLAPLCLIVLANSAMGCAVESVDAADQGAERAVQPNESPKGLIDVSEATAAPANHENAPIAHGAPQAGGASDAPASASACPEGAVATLAGNIVTCTFENLELPPTSLVFPDCTHVQHGYIGFQWPLSNVATYECPEGSTFVTGMTGTTAGTAYGACHFSIDPMPESATSLKAHCDNLESGVLSYSYQ